MKQEESPWQVHKTKIIIGFQILLSTALFYLLFSKIHIDDIKFLFLQSDPLIFAGVVGIKAVSIAASVFTLITIIYFFNHKIPKRKLSKIYFSSLFYNNLGVGTIGGDTYKWFAIKREISSKEQATLILITEKIVNFSMLVSFFALGSLIVYFSFHPASIILTIPLALVLIFLVQLVLQAFTQSKLFKFLSKFNKVKILFDHFELFYKVQPLHLSVATVFSFLFCLMNVATLALIVHSLNDSIPVSFSFLVIPVVILFTTLPLSFQGFGLREISITYMFSLFGYSLYIGAVAALLLLLANLLVSLLSGIYVLFQFKKSLGKSQEDKDSWHNRN